jgi:PAS domain S-box-containing protein
MFGDLPSKNDVRPPSRFPFSVLSVLIVVILCIAATLINAEHSRSRQEALSSIRYILDHMSPAIATSMARGDDVMLALQVESATNLPYIDRIDVVEIADSTLVGSTNPTAVADGDFDPARHLAGERTLVLPGTDQSSPNLMRLVAVADLSDARTTLPGLFLLYFVAGALGLGVTAFCVYQVSSRTSRFSSFDKADGGSRLGQGIAESTVTDEEIARRLAEAQRIACVGSWEWDLTDGRVEFSDELYRIYGLTPLFEEPGLERLQAAIHEDDVDRVAEGFAHLTAGMGALRQEYRIRRPDGTVRWIQCRRDLRLGEGGTPVKIMAIALDITDSKRTEYDLKRVNEHLEASVTDRTRQLELVNSELDAFAFSVSHDLRAPLRTIRSFTNIILEHHIGSMDPAAIKCLESIRRSTFEMVELIQGLLTLSRTSKVEMVRELVDLSGMATEIADRLRKQEKARSISFSIEPGLTAFGGRQFLEIALANLMGNAWKYTRYVGQGRVEFGTIKTKSTPVFFVRDNGAGFDMRYSSRLFKPFQRLHPPNQFEGNGIGLATVKRIFSRHGGEVWGEGAVDKGATFYFTLPDRENLIDWGEVRDSHDEHQS